MYTSKSCKNLLIQVDKAQILPVFEGDTDFSEKNREDVTGGPSIVFQTKKSIIDQICFVFRQIIARQ